ncbi:MAG: stress response serine/threonine protein kinase YihE [Burkholderiales bacterium 70-64]|nr:MAG: stress response serine/threonine protein kinase YihE [Burkholderiales bacterium 70-64]
MARSEPPYARLTPERILDALDAVGLRGDGRFLALNSYENRVYQVSLEDGRTVVAKFYRPGRWSDAQILEEHAFVAELAGREIPVVAPMPLQPAAAGHAGPVQQRPAEGGGAAPARADPPAAQPATLASFDGFRFAVYPRRGGRAPELDDPATLEWIGRFIGRIHAVGAIAPFVHRPALDPVAFGEEPRDWLLAHERIPADLLPAWRGIVDQALQAVQRAFDRAGHVRTLRLHGDCHAGNVLWTEQGPHFVDFDDARSGPAVQDLWMLLSGDRAAMARQLSDVLAGYEDFAEFDRRELQLVEPLRTLRLIHYSAWIARRWDDPAFPAAFPWFGSQRYWQDRVLELREQVAAMQEPPIDGV